MIILMKMGGLFARCPEWCSLAGPSYTGVYCIYAWRTDLVATSEHGGANGKDREYSPSHERAYMARVTHRTQMQLRACESYTGMPGAHAKVT